MFHHSFTMMSLSSVVCLCAFVSIAQGLWLEEVLSPRGLDLGAGINVRLESKNVSNQSSLGQSHVLNMDYGNYGLSFSKSAQADALEVDLIRRDSVTGRGQKMGQMLLPAIVGFKGAGLTALVLFSIKVIVIKALMVAKIALLTSLAVFIKKFLSHDHHHEPTYVEIEHHGSDQHPIFLDHGDADEGHAATNYVAYANYAPSATAQSQVINYAVEGAVGSNLTGSGQIVVPIAAKRFDEKKGPKLPFYSIRKVTVRTP